MSYQTVAESDAAEERRRRREEAREEARVIEQEGAEPVTSNMSGFAPENEASTPPPAGTDRNRVLAALKGEVPPVTLKDPTWRERLNMREHGREPLEVASTPWQTEAADDIGKAVSPFSLVGELPAGVIGRSPQIPRVRIELVDFAKHNMWQWIRYLPSADDPFKSVHGLAGQVRKGQAGFTEGFEAAVRDKQLYIRYVGEQPQ